MKWIVETIEQPRQRLELKNADDTLRVSISPAHDHPAEHFQFLLLSFGSHTSREIGESQASWPSEAIAKARQILDEFERELSTLKG